MGLLDALYCRIGLSQGLAGQAGRQQGITSIKAQIGRWHVQRPLTSR
jgi:hypothetical protein